MLSKAELDAIIQHTRDVIFYKQYLVAQAQMLQEAGERTRQKAYLVIEKCRVDAEQRQADRDGVSCKPHVPLLALVT